MYLYSFYECRFKFKVVFCIYLGLAFFFSLDGLLCSYVICFCCVRFSFSSTVPRDWLGRTSPKWSVLFWLGHTTLTHQSINILVFLAFLWFLSFRVLAALLNGTLVVGVSQTAALNRGRHLYSAEWPSRWALAHISSLELLLVGRVC